MWTAGDEPVVNAIRELRRGHWLASEGELVDGVLSCGRSGAGAAAAVTISI